MDQWAYHPGGPGAAEPAAWCALALSAHGRVDDALPAAKWLAQIQAEDGAVGIDALHTTPSWPTSLAILSWKAVDDDRFARPIWRAMEWTLLARGKTMKPNDQIGHDPRILGWSWADDTHAWMEPTCLFVLALKAADYRLHNRCRQGVALIRDRLLDEGGCNYGNTEVLGQMTMPHVQPTGLALMALADENLQDPRIEKSINYLLDEIHQHTPPASLSYALMGLTMQGVRPVYSDQLLTAAVSRLDIRNESCYKLALLALAATDAYPWGLQTIDRQSAPTEFLAIY